MRITRRLILLISMVATLTVAWPSAAYSQASSTCQFGELAYIVHNVNPDAQEVVVKNLNDFKFEGTLQRVLIKQQSNGDLDFTLCWTTAKPADSGAPIGAAVGVLVAIAVSCVIVYLIKKRPAKVVVVDM